MELGLDVLHRQVGALHEAHLEPPAARARDGRAPTRRARRARRASRAGRPAGRCRRRGRGRPGVVEGAAERRRREVEVAVLLHVEVDELRRSRLARDEVEAAQPVGDRGDRRLERQRIDVARDGGDLDRDVVDVGPAQPGDARRRAGGRPRRSPRIASPSRLTFSRTPSARRAATCRAKAGSAAGRMTPPLSRRSRRRTSGITNRGAAGAAMRPAAIRARSTRPNERRAPCTSGPSSANRWAARRSSRIRATSSVSANASSTPPGVVTMRSRRCRRRRSAGCSRRSTAESSAPAQASASSINSGSSGSCSPAAACDDAPVTVTVSRRDRRDRRGRRADGPRWCRSRRMPTGSAARAPWR